MDLKRIHIVGYKSVRNETIELDHDCTVLVGKNESGKTSILKAASMLPDGKFEIEDIHYKDEVEGKELSENYIKFVFWLNPTEIEEIVENELSKNFGEGLLNQIKVNDTKSEISIFKYMKLYLKSGNITFKPNTELHPRWYNSDAPEGSKLTSNNYIKLTKDKAVSLAGYDGAQIELDEVIVNSSRISSGVSIEDPDIFSLDDLDTVSYTHLTLPTKA